MDFKTDENLPPNVADLEESYAAAMEVFAKDGWADHANGCV